MCACLLAALQHLDSLWRLDDVMLVDDVDRFYRSPATPVDDVMAAVRRDDTESPKVGGFSSPRGREAAHDKLTS